MQEYIFFFGYEHLLKCKKKNPNFCDFFSFFLFSHCEQIFRIVRPDHDFMDTLYRNNAFYVVGGRIQVQHVESGRKKTVHIFCAFILEKSSIFYTQVTFTEIHYRGVSLIFVCLMNFYSSHLISILFSIPLIQCFLCLNSAASKFLSHSY